MDAHFKKTAQALGCTSAQVAQIGEFFILRWQHLLKRTRNNLPERFSKEHLEILESIIKSDEVSLRLQYAAVTFNSGLTHNALLYAAFSGHAMPELADLRNLENFRRYVRRWTTKLIHQPVNPIMCLLCDYPYYGMPTYGAVTGFCRAGFLKMPMHLNDEEDPWRSLLARWRLRIGK